MWYEAKCRASSNSHRFEWKKLKISQKWCTECIIRGGYMCWNMVWSDAFLEKCVASKRMTMMTMTMMILPRLRRRFFFSAQIPYAYSCLDVRLSDEQKWFSSVSKVNRKRKSFRWMDEWMDGRTWNMNGLCMRHEVCGIIFTGRGTFIHCIIWFSKCTYGMSGDGGTRVSEWMSENEASKQNEVKRQNRFDDIIVKQANRIETTQAIASL